MGLRAVLGIFGQVCRLFPSHGRAPGVDMICALPFEVGVCFVPLLFACMLIFFLCLRVLLTIYSALKESIFPRGHFHRPGEAAECSWSRRGLRSDWSEVAQPSHAPLEAAPSSSFTLSSLWGCFSCYKPTFMGFCSFDDSTLTLWIHWHRMLSLLISQCL